MINATSFSRLSRLLLLVLLQASLLTASAAPPALPSPGEVVLSKRAGQFLDFPSDYQGRVRKGEYLRALMPLDSARAAHANGGLSVVSPFRDENATARWGWTLGSSWYPFDENLEPMSMNSLAEAFRDKAFPVDKKQSGVYRYRHDMKFTLANGTEGQPTEASYTNVVNPSAGAFIFGVNYSPRYQVKGYGNRTVPDMEKLSDFAFFQWLEGCQYKEMNPTDLKVVFRAYVSYLPTFVIVLDALKEAGYRRVPGWKKRAVIKMGTRPGDAILGTTHGAGVAAMLIQHKDVLGVKEIEEAVVWGCRRRRRRRRFLWQRAGFRFTMTPPDAVLNIRFTIRSVEESVL
ncbi:hypothetical protein CTA2_9986 [Colletotrichum tanaceti]|uniref:Uncharacterized protein n=1 Tax=Colletotrichum tanaceti TaxID=1306861 RepID=A0A4U6X0Z1_9PEZI|nr:hypothetical protein CTA2_9986 [Colletotrichum tanaceti]TKW48553.1 hypothetical protein CTA1_6560 [Colletotrichum tanaceti]